MMMRDDAADDDDDDDDDDARAPRHIAILSLVIAHVACSRCTRSTRRAAKLSATSGVQQQHSRTLSRDHTLPGRCMIPRLKIFSSCVVA